MEECKYYKSVEAHGIVILENKIDDKVVIATRQRLLQVCQECPEQEDCETVKKFHKILRFK